MTIVPWKAATRNLLIHSTIKMTQVVKYTSNEEHGVSVALDSATLAGRTCQNLRSDAPHARRAFGPRRDIHSPYNRPSHCQTSI